MKSFYNRLISVLLFTTLGLSSDVYGHSVQVGYCVSCTGELTLYAEHWHANASPSSTTMTLELNINGVISTITGSPSANLQNIPLADLPGCVNPISIFASCPGQANTYNDWVVYNFPNLPCGVPIIITVLSGNSAFTQDACGMYPASTPVIFVPCNVNPPPVAASDQTICGPSSVNLTLTGFLNTIQWQSASSPGGPWADIPGATSTPFNTGILSATTYFRALETGGCASNVVAISMISAPVSNVGPDITSCLTNVPGTLGAAPTAGYTYSWSPPTGLSSTTVSNPSVTLSNPNTNITYTLITTGLGCFSTDSVVVIVNPLPTASISGTVATCEDSPPPNITFTGAGGTAPYTFHYKINSGTNQTVVTTNGNSVTVPAPTSVAGTFVYDLESVQESSSTNCSQLQTGSATVKVDPLPIGTITGTTTVCKNDAAPSITFTGSAGTAPYTFTYTINSGTNQIVSTTNGNSVNIPVPTTTATVYTYSLISINDASSSACSQTQSGSATVTVNPLPTATIAGTTTVCEGSASPNITFTGAAGTPPYTFTYSMNGGTSQTITTTSGNSVNLPILTTTANVFLYTLISVQDASSTACSQLQSGSATVTVSLLPTATITGTTAVCENGTAQNITFTAANGTPPYTFTYMINGGTNQTVTTINGNSVTVPVYTAIVGTFIFTLINVKEGSPTSCSQAQSGSATVTVNPMPVANFNFANVCLHQAMSFTDASTVSGGAVTGWSWNFGNSSPLVTTQDPIYTYVNPGTYTVSLITTSNSGCKDTIVKSAVVHPLPQVHYHSANVCDDSVAYFNDLSSILPTDTIHSWSWDFDDGSLLSMNQNTHHLYTVPGTYHVQLFVVSYFGCTDSLTKITTVNPNPIVNFSTNDTAGCSPKCINLLDLSSITSGSYAVQSWNFGDGNSSSEPYHCYFNNAVYSPQSFNVTLNVISDSGCFNTLSKNNYITVYPNPKANFTAEPEITTIIDPVISIVNLSVGTDVWNWNFGDLDTSSSLYPPPHTYGDTGKYIITLITSTQYGCYDTSSQTVIIEPDFVFYIPNTFSPNNDGINDTFFGKGILIKTYEMMIFDRWGNLIFFSDNLDKHWDGKANLGDKIAQQDDYVYVIKLTDIHRKQHQYKGIVTLVR